MAGFTPDMQSYKPSSFSFLDIDPNMELMNEFSELNRNTMDNPSLNFQSFNGLSIDNLFVQQHQPPEFPGNLAENFPGVFHQDDDENNVLEGNQVESIQSKKRKAVYVPASSSGNSSVPVSEDGIRRKNSSGKGKRRKSNTQEEEEKPKEVVHVRAKRGQATDSHSLAERVRRGKINERLRCLQGIVPGCYKTMGMAVMLDEIINYVQSLQSQVEFLSMKLTAASKFYDFNSETDAMEAMQRAKAYEAQKVQRLVTQGYQGHHPSTQLGPFDLTFGSYPSLPHNT